MRPTVMVVADDPTFCNQVSRLLDAAGYDCTWMNRGGTALVILEATTKSPDLFVLGDHLADIPGPRLAEQISLRFPSARILLLPRVGGVELQQRVTPEELSAELGRLLEQPAPAPRPSLA